MGFNSAFKGLTAYVISSTTFFDFSSQKSLKSTAFFTCITYVV